MMRPDILTNSGVYFDFFAPATNAIIIEDIAHALSNICRFNGHCRDFYSVAQHSILTSYNVPHEFALEALLHDAAEAYVGDVTAPLNQLIPDYKVIEQRVHEAIFVRFGLNPELPKEVKFADLIMLATEQRDLMAPHDDQWALIEGINPLWETIFPISSTEAEMMFLNRFYCLMKERIKHIQ